MFWPCETRTSTCRNFATISSGVYRFFGIAVLLHVKRHSSGRTTSKGEDQEHLGQNDPKAHGVLRYRRLRARACWRQGTCLRPGIGTFFSLPPLLHSGPSGAPITPFEIDGATQVWHSSARYAQFRAPAFPSSLPCRSRCRALAGLVRARTSDDIRPRYRRNHLPTPPCTQPMLPRASLCGQRRFTPGVHFGGNSN